MEINGETGKQQVLSVIAIAIAISITIIAGYAVSFGFGHMPPQLVHFALTITLCFFLYKKHGWARWACGALFIVEGIGALVSGIAILSSTPKGWGLLAIAIAYGYCGTTLLLSKEVANYMKTEQPSDVDGVNA